MVTEEVRRALGVVQTPPGLVDFMVALARPIKKPSRVLEPACGDCPFLEAFARRYGYEHHFVGVEIHGETARRARERVPFATVVEGDFLLWEPEEGGFDIIIGNPPYGIIGDEKHYPIHTLKERKELYKKRFLTWQGKFNIYGAFIEHAVRLLNPGGQLVFVVPASWLVLDDFSRLRVHLALMGHLSIYHLGKAFKGRNVSVVVLVLKKGGRGLDLYEGTLLRVSKAGYDGDLIRFETPETRAWEEGGVPLGGLFRIHFAARSPEVRAHPGVTDKPREGFVPILTGRNLKPGWIDYETPYSGLWMPREAAPTLRPFYGFPHLVVGHTKGVRVVAAVDWKCYPWREEFHLIPRTEGIDLEKVAAYLNSESVQAYMYTLYRDFVPHVTRTMLKRLPLPREVLLHNFMQELL